MNSDNCAHTTIAVGQYCRGKTVSVDEILTTPAETGTANDAETWDSETVEIKAEKRDYEVTQGGLPEAMGMMSQRIVIVLNDDGSTSLEVDVDNSARQVRLPYVDAREKDA